MKKIIKKPLWFTVITILCIIVVTMFVASGCNKSEISPIENDKKESDNIIVEGTIIAYIPPCRGNGILISVENIQDFGETGYYRYFVEGGIDSIKYQNAILIPNSIKGTNPNSHFRVGDKLKFVCREVTTDADRSFFAYNHPCLAIYGPIPVPRYIVITVLNHQKK